MYQVSTPADCLNEIAGRGRADVSDSMLVVRVNG
jgi:hypothetical protein